VRRKERRESLTGLSDSLTESLSQKIDDRFSKLSLFEKYHRGKLAIHPHVSDACPVAVPLVVLDVRG
jgi:hypothetical protein